MNNELLCIFYLLRPLQGYSSKSFFDMPKRIKIKGCEFRCTVSDVVQVLQTGIDWAPPEKISETTLAPEHLMFF